jgi:predicted nucleotidyltransferase
MKNNNKKNLTRLEDTAQKERDFHDHNLTLLPNIINTLFKTIETIEDKNIPYALFGGIAGKELGRPRVTHDIDLLVRPDDADYVLKILEEKGFETEKRDEAWLYKAWSDDILVDVIFRSCGDIYFEEEVRSHVRRIKVEGKMINTISPEDFIVIKAAAHREDNPHHWHDALAVLKQGDLDWDYLLRRARYCPRRILSLLIYAQSNDITIPSDAIDKLYKTIYVRPDYQRPDVYYPYKEKKTWIQTEPHIYLVGRIMEAITNDERTADHDIKVDVAESEILINGEVFSEEQKNALNDVIQKIDPTKKIKNQVLVRVLNPAIGYEAIR